MLPHKRGQKVPLRGHKMIRVMMMMMLSPRRALLARATPRVVGHQKHLTKAAHKQTNQQSTVMWKDTRPSQDVRRHRHSFFKTPPHVIRFALKLDRRSHSVLHTYNNIRAAATATVVIWCTKQSCPHQGIEIPTSSDPGRGPTTRPAMRQEKLMGKRWMDTPETKNLSKHGKHA